MAIIVIAYNTYDINGKQVRVYDDSTEKYFESRDVQDAQDYIAYLGFTDKNYAIEISEITIYKEGEFDVDELFRKEALAKLSDKEKEVLGL